MDSAKSKDEFRRYQSLYLRVAEKMPTTLISKITGLSQSHIQSIHSSARTKGLASLASKPKGGRRRSHLSTEEEIALLSEIEKKAIKGGVVEIGKVHKLFEEKAGGKVAKNTAYRLLHRYGWRKITPRPYHPKQKDDAIETFKKTGLLWSKMQS
jgi:transposase